MGTAFIRPVNRIRWGIYFASLVLASLLVFVLIAVSIRVVQVQEPSFRLSPPSHLLLVALDSRGGNDAGLPDALILVDLQNGHARPISRDWTDSKQWEGASLMESYASTTQCSLFCGIQGIYAYGQSRLSSDIGSPKGLGFLAQVIEAELKLESLAFVSVDLTWSYSFLNRIGPVSLNVEEPIPVGGIMRDGEYTQVQRMIPAGAQDLAGEALYWFARARFGSSNEDRMDRHLVLLEALLTQKSAWEIGSAAWNAKGQLLTDLSLYELFDVANALLPTPAS